MSSNKDDFDPDNLENFNGRGIYSDPEFEWNQTLGPTALKFLHSDKLGPEYQNDIFVGSIVTGRLYHFDLNEDRTELVLTGELDDKIAETRETGEEDIVFGEGFGGISDMEVGPHDGYLYVVSLGQGKIFRIVPSGEEGDSSLENGDNRDDEDEEEKDEN